MGGDIDAAKITISLCMEVSFIQKIPFIGEFAQFAVCFDIDSCRRKLYFCSINPSRYVYVS